MNFANWRWVRISIFLPFLLFSPLVLSAAQWIEQDSGSAVRLWAVWGSGSTDVFAVGESGTILHFDGDAWSAMESGTSNHLYGVYGYGPGDVYAVGSLATVLHYDGNSWSPVAINAITTTPELRDVWIPAVGQDIYVFGSRTGLQYDPGADPGTAWTRISFQEGFSFTFTPPAQFTGASGYLEGGIVRFINSANGTFATIPDLYVFKKPFLTDWQLESVWAVSPTDIYTVGNRVAKRFKGGDIRSSSAWKTIPLGDTTTPLKIGFDVWAADASNVFTVGQTFSAGGGIAFYDGNETDDWQTVHTTTYPLRSVFGFGPADVFAVGDQGTILRYFENETSSTAANYPYSGVANQFVDGFTGELLLSHVDLDLAGPLPVVFHRYYASGLKRDVGGASDMGNNWSHNFNWRLTVGIVDGVEKATVISSRGQHIEFEKTAEGWVQLTALDSVYQLKAAGSSLRLLDVKAELTLVFGVGGSRLLALLDRRGSQLVLEYSADGDLDKVSDGKGRVLQFSHADGRIEQISYEGLDWDGIQTAPAVRNILFSYDAEGNLLTTTDQAGGVTTYSYDGNRLSDGLLTGVQRPELNTPYGWTYDADGRAASQQAADGGSTMFSYQSGTTPATVTQPNGATRRLRHTDDGQLVSMTDELGNEATFTYDDRGRRITSTDRNGTLVSASWHEGSGKIASETNPGTGTVNYEYNEQTGDDGQTYFDLVLSTWTDGSTDSYTYDPAGNQLSWTDAENRTSRYVYDGAGNLTQLTRPGGGAWTMTYDASGNLVGATSTSGANMAWDYDGFGNVIKTRYPDDNNNTASHIYDARGRLVRYVDEDNHTTQFEHDGNGRLRQIRGPQGFVATYEYDTMDRIRSIANADGEALQYEYDQRGNITLIVDQSGARDKIEYDAANRPVAYLPNEQESLAVRMEFSKEWVVTGVKRASGRNITSELSVDGSGRRHRVMDAETTLGYTYNQRGQEEHIRDGSGQAIVSRTHAMDGDLTGLALPRAGINSSFKRDAYGAVSDITDPAAKIWRFERNDMGQLTTVADPLGQATNYEYDSRSRIARVRYPAGLGALDMEYDGRGNVKKQTWSDGTVLEFEYDGLNQLVSGSGIAFDRDTNGNIEKSNGITNGYDPSDRLETVDFGEGRVITYVYRPDGLIAAVKDWLGQSVAFEYDVDGKVKQLNRANGLQTVFAYDEAGRMSGIDHGSIGSVVINIEPLGEISSVLREPSAGVDVLSDSSFGYDDANGRFDASYNALGQLLQGSERSLTWDLAGRVKSVQVPGEALQSYTYDGLGMRLTGNDNNYTWNYAFGMPVISQIHSGNGDVRYVHLPNGRLLYRIVNGQRQFYHFDEAGNTMALTDPSGNLLARYIYSPYGEVLADSPTFDNPFTWLGVWNAVRDDTGLYYLRTRYYNPELGRFLSRDPYASASPRSTNPYLYALGNPVRYSDPSGLWPLVNQNPSVEESEAKIEDGFFKLLEKGLDVAGELVEKHIEAPAKRAMASLVGLSRAHWDSYRNPVRDVVLTARNRLPINQLKYVDGQMARERFMRAVGKGGKAVLNGGGMLVTAYTEQAENYTTTTVTRYAGKTLVAGTDALLSAVTGPASWVSDSVDWASETWFGPNVKVALFEPVRNAGRAAVAVADDGYAFLAGDPRYGQASRGLVRQIQQNQGFTGYVADKASPVVQALSPLAWLIHADAAYDTYKTEQKLTEMRVRHAMRTVEAAQAQAARAGRQ